MRGLPVRQAVEQARPFIKLVGLEGFEESYPGELSGGMEQRVNLARALAVQPKVLLCDEPLSALDAQTREQMQVELQRIWMETRLTTIYVTHQISEALFLADRIVVLTGRPGTIRTILEARQPRPRSLHPRRNLSLLEMEDQIWELIRDTD